MLSQIEILDVMDRLARLPDDATISNDMGALYLGISSSSLSVMRQKGEGPDYIQYPTAGSKARNQKVIYRMGDVRSWRNSKKVSSTMEAAEIRGMAFSTIGHMSIHEPFFVLDSIIQNHATDLTQQEFIDAINSGADVQNITINDVLQYKWDNTELQEKYINQAKVVFDNAINNYNKALQASQLESKLN
jgi:hypothetical protein